MRNTVCCLMLGLFLFSLSCETAPDTETTNVDTTTVTDPTPDVNPDTKNPAGLTSKVDPTDPVMEEDDQKSDLTNQVFYARVDNLNLRAAPNTTSEIVKQIREDDAVIFTGEQTDHTEKITLRGVAYERPWMKVKTDDNKTGWVFGGAIYHKATEKKVPAPVLDFEHFGQIDLNDWVSQGTVDDSGEEVDGEKTTYTSDQGTLIFTTYEVGEFGYGNTYSLRGPDGQLQKVRELNWINLEPGFELTETIYDFTRQPVRSYTRKQAYETHYYRLKQRPQTVVGTFKEASLSDEEVATLKKQLGS